MKLSIQSLAIPDVKLIKPLRHEDARGYFCEAWNRRESQAAGLDVDFVQDNQSLSRSVATVRGLHFQRDPYAQGKLVRVLRGSIFDVAVDLRIESATFGRWVGVELSAKNAHQLWVPRGFAHGFCTLVANTEVFYKTDAYYMPDADAGLRWDDPRISVSWPLGGREPVLSDKDRGLPTLSQMELRSTKVAV